VVDRLERAFGARIVSVAHRPISGWKDDVGAERLWVATDDGRLRTVVMKRLDYSMAALPAANIMPFDISQTERVVFAESGLDQRFIPSTFAIIGPGEFHDGTGALVVMEDLAPKWRRPRLHHDYALVVGQLDNIHQAISRIAGQNIDQERLIRYDQALAEPLSELFEKKVIPELVASKETELSRWPANWETVKQLMTSSALPDVAATFVHGDFTPAHIFIRWMPRRQLRLIDFEWVGVGFPHADLASLLKRARPSIEELTLRLYAARHREISLVQHRVVYEWCQLCRGLLDAVYLVTHRRMIVPQKEPIVSRYSRSSLRRAWIASERLVQMVESDAQ
jgi:hypothetical protein